MVTTSPISAVRALRPDLSPAEAREVVLAVLGAVREPSEAIALAIYERRNGAGCTPWSRLPKAHQDPYRGDARAAIDALVAEVQEEGR